MCLAKQPPKCVRLAAQRVRNHGGNNRERLVWAAFLLGAVLLLNVGNAIVYGGGDPLAALVLASVQFIITLWGYPLPRPVDWVPLLALAVTVGFFEAVFFRGFIETRLEASFGPIAGVAGAAALYAANGMAYHVGYGMGGPKCSCFSGSGSFMRLPLPSPGTSWSSGHCWCPSDPSTSAVPGRREHPMAAGSQGTGQKDDRRDNAAPALQFTIAHGTVTHQSLWPRGGQRDRDFSPKSRLSGCHD